MWGGAKSQRQAHSQVIGQVVLLQGVRFKAVGHRVEVIIAYPTDEALGLEDKKNVKTSECTKQNKRRTLGQLHLLTVLKDHHGRVCQARANFPVATLYLAIGLSDIDAGSKE